MERNAKWMLAAATTLFGTIGLFRRAIPLSSSVIACVRGFVGAAFLMLFLLLRGKRLSKEAIKANAKLLALSGTAIGLNWVLLFEAYNYTSVAIATLCYYMAPIIVILVSPMLLHETLTKKKLFCVFTALLGMVFVSGVLNGESRWNVRGILFGLGAAALYASVMLLNQKLGDIGTYDKTVTQLTVAAVVLVPYLALTEDFSGIVLTTRTVLLLLVIGVIHTGVAYALYFGSMGALRVQTVAIFSYIDPVVAISLSALFLREPLGASGIIGAVLILGATLYSEV